MSKYQKNIEPNISGFCSGDFWTGGDSQVSYVP